VKPNPCDLKWAKGIVPTAYGNIAVNWRKAGNGNFSLYVLVPEKTTAEIAVPATDASKVTVNGKPVGIYKIESGKVLFKASPGEYEIQSIK